MAFQWKRIVAAGCVLSLLFPALAARGDILESIGNFLGQPLGGFLGAASAPVVANVEGAANNIVANVDQRVNADIDHAGSVVSGVATQALQQADEIATARIGQIFSDADSSVGKGFVQAGALESKAVKDVKDLVKQVDGDVQRDIAKVDNILDARINQVDGVVKGAISQVDDDIKARIDQADDAAQKALGTADVLAAKELLGLQAALLKIGAMLGAVAFLVAALKYFFDHLPEYLRDVEELEKMHGQDGQGAPPSAAGPALEKARRALRMKYAKSSLALLAVHVVFGGVCIGLLMLAATYLPLGARKDAKRLTKTHETALRQSLLAFDFTKVRYHAAELAILSPEKEQTYRALQRRADLIRTLLTRPGLLATADGVRQLSAAIDAAERAQVTEDGATFQSPDVIAAAAYVRWQLATSRPDEVAAAGLFAHAFEVDADPKSKDSRGPFVLAPLAARYLDLFCQRRSAAKALPLSKLSLDDACTRGQRLDAGKTAFSSFDKYDDAVLTLDRQSDEAWLKMLDAQATLEQAKASHRSLDGALRARREAATSVRDAWLLFDRGLRQDSTLPASAQMASFWLNDVPLVQAAWVLTQPDDVELPLRMSDIHSPAVRAVVSPARISWTRRYLNSLSAPSQAIAAREVVQLYQDDEKRTVAFAASYLAYKAALAKGSAKKERDEAAKAASAMGIYDSGTPRKPLAATLLDETKATPVNVADDGVRLRLL